MKLNQRPQLLAALLLPFIIFLSGNVYANGASAAAIMLSTKTALYNFTGICHLDYALVGEHMRDIYPDSELSMISLTKVIGKDASFHLCSEDSSADSRHARCTKSGIIKESTTQSLPASDKYLQLIPIKSCNEALVVHK
jgi:hypothetical protein